MPAAVRVRRVLLLALAVPAFGGCIGNPKMEALRQQQITEIGDAINDLRIDVSTMTNTLDSLRVVIAKQDTTIMRLANVTGVVVVK